MENYWIVDRGLSFTRLRYLVEKQLLENVVPFWIDHGVSEKDGAINTCIRDDGHFVSGDRYILSQCRALWTFSALYNRVDKQAQFLAIAQGIFRYLASHGRDEDGNWVYRLDADAKVVEGAISVLPAGFAIYGLAEYFAATGDEAAMHLAIETYDNVKTNVLAFSGEKQLHPLPDSNLVAHSVFMLYGLAILDLALVTKDDRLIEKAQQIGELIWSRFVNPKNELLYEYISTSGKNAGEPLNHIIIPGHAIESMWFLIHLFKNTGQNDKIASVISCIKLHLELGWDEEYGGLFLAIDDRGQTPEWSNWDSKPWWIVTEVLYALVLCFQESNETWCIEWFQKVQRFAYAKYPDRKHGEWIQKLDRFGNQTNSTIGLPVKDPFHLPRSLILTLDILRK